MFSRAPCSAGASNIAPFGFALRRSSRRLNGSKTAKCDPGQPRSHRDGPKAFQDIPKTAPEGLETVQVAPKIAQDGLKTAQAVLKTAQEGSTMTSKRPSRGKND